VKSGGGTTTIRGFSAPPIWVPPVFVATLAFGVVLTLIVWGFCFSCAAQAMPIWPFVALALLLPYGRGFRVDVDTSGVRVAHTFFGVPLARGRAAEATVSSIPDGPTARFGAAIHLGARTFFVGSQRTARALVDALRSATSADD
jgi:hypothetical protein